MEWNKFEEIGNTIHKMRGVVSSEKAKERYELYETLLPKIACYLDGYVEIIQNAVVK